MEPDDVNYKPLHAYIKADGRECLPDRLKPYADSWNLLQHRILTRRWQKQTDDTGRFTLLKREYVNEELGKDVAAKLLNWGRNEKVLVCDDRYVEGQKSLGYRLCDRLEELPTRRLPLTDERLVERVKEFQRRDSKSFTKAHRHLRRWHDRVSIDVAATSDADLLSISPEQLEANRGAVRMLLDREHTFGVCDYGRVHTNITRLFRPLRRHLRLGGESLVSIDIANSQPLFLGVSLLQDLDRFLAAVPSAASAASALLSSSAPTCFPPHSPMSLSPIRCQNEVSGSRKCEAGAEDTEEFKMPETVKATDDVKQYLDTCSRGVLYPRIMAGMGWEGTKDAFKSAIWFAYLYGSNKDEAKLGQAGREGLKRLNEYFRATYPTVYQFIWWKKEQNYRRLACDMQRAESRLMIDGVAGRLAEEYPDIPVLTIHDSYLTTKEHLPTITRLILDEFDQLGIVPFLSIEDYGQTAEQDDTDEEIEEDTRAR